MVLFWRVSVPRSADAGAVRSARQAVLDFQAGNGGRDACVDDEVADGELAVDADDGGTRPGDRHVLGQGQGPEPRREVDGTVEAGLENDGVTCGGSGEGGAQLAGRAG